MFWLAISAAIATIAVALMDWLFRSVLPLRSYLRNSWRFLLGVWIVSLLVFWLVFYVPLQMTN